MQKQPNSRYCFLCGLENPLGLHLAFYEDDDNRVIARYVQRDEHQGYPGVLHGGITCALLDETIGRTLVRQDIWAMTVQIDVRFRKPVPLGEEITVIGEMVRLRSRTMEGKGEIRLADGSIAATAAAKYVRLPDAEIARFRDELGFWQVVADREDAGDGPKPGPPAGI